MLPQLIKAQFLETMKSQLQVLTFLSHYHYATEFDRNVIVPFLERVFRITPKTTIFSTTSDSLPIDAQSFTQWYKDGYALAEIAKNGNDLVMLGRCTLTTVNIIGILKENIIEPTNLSIPTSQLSKASNEEVELFLHTLHTSKLQFYPNRLSLDAKYIPRINEKVIFNSYDFNIKGIGIVRSVDHNTGKVEFYCYFTYPTKTAKAQLGYSMHECDTANLYGYIFEPLLENGGSSVYRFSTDSGTSMYRRLKSELKNAGKVWADKIRRIEPTSMRRKQGEKYWYISDKLSITQSTDNWTSTSHMRFLSGNYFVTEEAAKGLLGKIKELVNNYLASSNWSAVDE